MGTRYESRREASDFSVLDYLLGNTQLNTSATPLNSLENDANLGGIITDLKLDQLLDMPLTSLSNGQRRRAKLAKALSRQPELLLLDEPFSKSQHGKCHF